MSHPAPLPCAHLKRLATFIDAQDGSQTQKELLPLMRASLSVGRSSPPSEDVIAENIRVVQLRVRHRQAKQRRWEAAEAQSAAAEEQAANTRSRRRNSAPASTTSTSTSRRSKGVKKVEATAQTRAEDKLVAALAALRVRNVQCTEMRNKAAEEEKKARAANRKAEKKEREAKVAEEKKEKQERTAKQRADEQELKDRIRDQRANSRSKRQRRSMFMIKYSWRHWREQKDSIKKMEILIDLETEALKAKRREKRAKKVADEEDKENVEPEGEWQVRGSMLAHL